MRPRSAGRAGWGLFVPLLSTTVGRAFTITDGAPQGSWAELAGAQRAKASGPPSCYRPTGPRIADAPVVPGNAPEEVCPHETGEAEAEDWPDIKGQYKDQG